MSGMNAAMGSARGDQLEAGFAKLQGEDFKYIMQSYEIIVGRNSKKGKVDFDLSAVGGDRDVSRRHARIFYDFQHRSFALEALGQHGCYVQRVLHRPGDDPVKLKSQDLIQIGQTQRLFTVPIKMSSVELKTGPINVERGTLSLLHTYVIFISLLYCAL